MACSANALFRTKWLLITGIIMTCVHTAGADDRARPVMKLIIENGCVVSAVKTDAKGGKYPLNVNRTGMTTARRAAKKRMTSGSGLYTWETGHVIPPSAAICPGRKRIMDLKGIPANRVDDDWPDLVLDYIQVLDVTESLLTYKFRFSNQSQVNIGDDVYIGIYLTPANDAAAGDIFLMLWRTDGLLSMEEFETVYVEAWLGGIPDGHYYLAGHVDPFAYIGESDRSNNTAADLEPSNIISVAGAPLTDLEINSLEVTRITGNVINYSFSVMNRGAYPVFGRNSECHVYLTADSLLAIKDYRISMFNLALNTLDAYATKSYNAASTVTGVADGNYYLWCFLDAGYDMIEESETNNAAVDYSNPVSFSNVPKPDLEADFIDVVNAGSQTLEYTCRIFNNSSYDVTNQFDMAIFLSKDLNPNASEDPWHVWTEDDPFLPYYTWTWSNNTLNMAGVPDGSYYVYLRADYFDDIMESDENNNRIYDSSGPAEITGTSRPDLYLHDLELLDEADGTLTFRYAVGNNSDQDCAMGFYNGCYLLPDETVAPDDEILYSGYYPSIDAHEIATSIDLNLDISQMANGSYYLIYETDIYNTVAENNEENNRSTDNPVIAVEGGSTAVPAISPAAGTGPHRFGLDPCYPNPFNAVTLIGYSVQEKGRVLLDVYTIGGQRVATLVDRTMEPGEYNVKWNAAGCSSGVYMIQLKNENHVVTERGLLIR